MDTTKKAAVVALCVLVLSCGATSGPVGPPGPALTPGSSVGPPATGSNALGDLYLDSAARLWVCTEAGAPGTWASAAYRNDGVAASWRITSSYNGHTIAGVTVIDFGEKEYDTDNAVTPGDSWTFKVPPGKAGIYHVSTSVSFNPPAGLVDVGMNAQVNPGNFNRRIWRNTVNAGFFAANGSVDLNLGEGATVSLLVWYVANDTVKTISVEEGWIQIHRVLGL